MVSAVNGMVEEGILLAASLTRDSPVNAIP